MRLSLVAWVISIFHLIICSGLHLILFDRWKIFVNWKIERGRRSWILLVSFGQQIHYHIIDFGYANDIGDLKQEK